MTYSAQNTRRSKRRVLAEQCLIATCLHMSMTSRRDESFDIYLGMLRDILPDCEVYSGPLAPLYRYALQLVQSEQEGQRANSLARIRFESKCYVLKSSAARYEAWQKTAIGGADV